MKLPIFWLKDYIKVPENLDSLTDKLTAIGHMQDHKPEIIDGEAVLDLEIRQNRSDCLSIVGLARESAAVLNIDLSLPQSFTKKLPDIDNGLIITNESEDLCYRFNTLSFDGVEIKKSPKWLSKKLETYGIKSINNLVDIANFVMVETGQPLHLLNSQDVNKHIFIRKAQDNESVAVLGNKTVKLTNSDLVIANKTEILAIAGVIGSLQKAINNSSHNIIVEAATYNQASIRKTALKYDLRTEASLRNEKFLSTKMTEMALNRASELIIDLCGGKIVSHNDYYPKPINDRSIVFDLNQIKRLGGIEVKKEEVKSIFSKLGISTTDQDTNKIIATIPYFRTDLEQEADLVEEVLRINGYDKIPDRLLDGSTPKDIQSIAYLLEEEIRNLLIGLGFDEEITEPLTNESEPILEPVFLENSLNSEKTMLRTTLKNGLIGVLKNRRKYRKDNSLIFELGKIYYISENNRIEQRTLGGIISTEKVSYFDIKGIIETLLERLGYKYSDGFVKIEVVKANNQTWYFEINLEKLLGIKRGLNQKVLTTPPQIIFEDLSITLPKNIRVGELINIIKQISPLLYRVELGENPRYMDTIKTVFLKLSFCSFERTLSTKDVESVRWEIIKTLEDKYEAKLR